MVSKSGILFQHFTDQVGPIPDGRWVHSWPEVALKEIILRYKDGSTIKETRPYKIPTGVIEGKEAIVFANSKDKIVVAWDNIWEKIIKYNVLEPGAIVRGGAVFVLDQTLDRIDEINDLCIVVRDFLENKTELSGQPVQDWQGILEKGFSLVDAPAKKVGEEIIWEGLTLTTEKPA